MSLDRPKKNPDKDHEAKYDTISNEAYPVLTVKEEYASLVPKISDSEYQSIRQSMKDNGQWVPIIINSQRIILD